MSKFLYLLMSSFLFFSCLKEKTKINQITYHKIDSIYVDKDELELIGIKGVWLFGEELFNGYARKYHKNGVLAEEVGFYLGKKEGIAKKWYSNGNLKKEYYYSMNSINGVSKSYWPNGQLAKEVFYKKGQIQGIETSWHQNGVISKKRNLVDNKEIGIQQAWLPNGKLYVNYEAKNGRIFGMKKAVPCYSLESEKVVRYDEDKE